jgi:hypothetical protein
MAVVPNDEIATTPQDPLPGRAYPRFSDDASPSSFGAGLGEGIEKAASDYGSVQLQQAAQAKRDQDKAHADAGRVQGANAVTAASQAVSGILFGKDATDPNAPYDPTAVYRQSGKALATLPGDAMDRLNGALDNITQGLPPHIQAMVADHFAGVKDSFNLQVHRYQFEQSNREATEAFNNAGTQAIADVGLNYRDPAATPRAFQMVRAAGESLAEQGGKDALKAYNDGGYRKDFDKVLESGLGGFLADNNVAGAQRYLNQYKDQFSSGEVRETLQNRVTAAGDRLEAKQKEGAQDAYADATKAAQAGLPGAGNLVTDHQLQVLRPQDWERQREFLGKLAEAGTSEKKYDTMPPAAILDDVQSKKPTTATPGIANDLEAFHLLQEGAQRSLQRRAEDPAGFVLSTGQGWQPLDLSKPLTPQNTPDVMAQLKTRANTAPDISERLGVPVPLLSKPESKALGQQFASQGPTGQLSLLTGLRQGLPNDTSYESVLHQIAPASPVAAVAGMMVDRPTDRAAPTWYNPKFSADPQVAQRILQGESILRGKGEEATGTANDSGVSKSGFAMPADKELQPAFQSAIGGSNSDLFKGRPQSAELYYRAYRDYYAAAASEKGISTGQYSSDIAEEAGQKIFGSEGSATYNHSNLVVPHGMDPSRFEGTMDKAVQSSLSDAGYKPGQIAALKEMPVRELGPTLGTGRYVITRDDGLPLKTPDGKDTVIIDLHKQFSRAAGPIERPSAEAQAAVDSQVAQSP